MGQLGEDDVGAPAQRLGEADALPVPARVGEQRLAHPPLPSVVAGLVLGADALLEQRAGGHQLEDARRGEHRLHREPPETRRRLAVLDHRQHPAGGRLENHHRCPGRLVLGEGVGEALLKRGEQGERRLTLRARHDVVRSVPAGARDEVLGGGERPDRGERRGLHAARHREGRRRGRLGGHGGSGDGPGEGGWIERLVLGGEAGQQHGEDREGDRSAHVPPSYDGSPQPVKTSAGLLW